MTTSNPISAIIRNHNTHLTETEWWKITHQLLLFIQDVPNTLYDLINEAYEGPESIEERRKGARFYFTLRRLSNAICEQRKLTEIGVKLDKEWKSVELKLTAGSSNFGGYPDWLKTTKDFHSYILGVISIEDFEKWVGYAGEVQLLTYFRDMWISPNQYHVVERFRHSSPMIQIGLSPY